MYYKSHHLARSLRARVPQGTARRYHQTAPSARGTRRGAAAACWPAAPLRGMPAHALRRAAVRAGGRPAPTLAACTAHTTRACRAPGTLGPQKAGPRTRRALRRAALRAAGHEQREQPSAVALSLGRPSHRSARPRTCGAPWPGVGAHTRQTTRRAQSVRAPSTDSMQRASVPRVPWRAATRPRCARRGALAGCAWACAPTCKARYSQKASGARVRRRETRMYEASALLWAACVRGGHANSSVAHAPYRCAIGLRRCPMPRSWRPAVLLRRSVENAGETAQRVSCRSRRVREPWPSG